MSSPENLARSGAEKAALKARFAEWPGLAVIFAQVVLISFVLRNASIETLGFHRIVYLAAFGFVVNHLLPAKFRLNFFLLFSIVSMVVALGGSADSGTPEPALGIARFGVTFCIGVLLIGICHLPIRFWKRGVLLLCIGLVAAEFRSEQWDGRVLAVVWPVLAALFMFRIIVYLYDVSTSARCPTKAQSLAYFFLTPNFCALLFPVIDFRTFSQTYYNEDALVIYQRGARWMTRGVIQLLVYRLVHQLFALDASAISDGTDLIQFVVANVFLYLKVSGSFHLFIGMLLLFGFNLPETNHRFFLASSFTDYWRRVNIYWRAFIMKVFYYPTFFRLKNLGQVPALVIATLWCFVVTWALHIYQTWWIKGTVSWTWTDALFWATLGLLVLVNSLWELKRNRKRKLARGSYSPKEAVGVTLRTALTFSLITVLWSLWSTPNLKLWFHIWSLADLNTLAWGCATVACVMAATVLFEIMPVREGGRTEKSMSGLFARTAGLPRDALKCAVALSIILMATYLSARFRRDPSEFHNFPIANGLLQTLADEEAPGQGRGYYENLTSVDEGSGKFWEAMTTLKTSFAFNSINVVNDANVHELVPNAHLVKDCILLETNRWGMRDRDRDLAKPPATLRIAVLGSSHVMGYGLQAKDMFVPILESRLNSEHHSKGAFEILNFAVSGQGPVGQIWTLEHRVSAFHPDIVFFVAFTNDFEWATRDVVWDLHRNIALPSDFPSPLLARAGVTHRTLEPFAVQRLRSHDSEVLSYCYRQIVRECRSINALPVCIFLPVPHDLPLDRARVASLLQIGADAGFITIDLSDIYAGHDPNELMLRDIGRHSNARAHAIIANALYDRLTADPRIDLFDIAERISANFASESLVKKSPD